MNEGPTMARPLRGVRLDEKRARIAPEEVS